MSISKRAGLQIVLALLTAVTTGCASVLPAPVPDAAGPAPTVAPMFVARPVLAAPGAVSTVPAAGGQVPPPTTGALPAGAPTPAATAPSPAPAPAQTPDGTSVPGGKVAELAIYDEALNADWSTEHTEGMTYSLTDKLHAYSGSVGLSILPEQDLGRFFFTVRPDAKESYDLYRVFGVSMWINSGSEAMDPSNLSVTVVGSNDYSYWVANDQSVKIDERHFFSESRLYFLGINRPIPPNTWVEVVVWLDKLPYEPEYKNITGIYITNDRGFKREFYIDRVHLLMTG